MSIRFANPWVLYLLWVAIGYACLCVLRIRRQRQALDQFMTASMRARLAPPFAERRVMIQTVLSTLGLLLALIALSRPQWGERDETVLSRGRDVVIALDVSRSMLAEDVHPNRLSRAKADILDLLQALKGDRAALLVFRHKASLLSPLTTDYGYLRLILEGVDIDSAPRGETDIGEAIRAALDAFEERSGAHRTIVLISDGEDLSGQAKEAADVAQKAGVPIYTIGFGREQGTRIPSETGGYLAHEGTEVTTHLDHNTLEQIARTTGGAYIPIGTASLTKSNLGTIYQDYLTSIDTKEFSESQKRRHIDRFQYFLLPALMCFMIVAGLSQGRPQHRVKATTPPPLRSATRAALWLLFAGMMASTTQAASEETFAQAREAQSAFKKGNYEEAAALYREALRSPSGAMQKDLLYNEAVALFHAGRYEESASRFEELSLSLPNIQDTPAMELGMALYHEALSATPTNSSGMAARTETMKRAAEAFRDAHRAEPNAQATAEANMKAAMEQFDRVERESRAAALQEKYGSQQPGQLVGTLLALERDIVKDALAALTNPSPSRIEQLERVARSQADAADALAMLKPSLRTESDKDTAALQNHATSIENSMRAASRALRDLDDSGFSKAASAESALYPLWKGVADPDALLKEDLLRQSRVVAALSNPPPYEASVSADQGEGVVITDLFKQRFESMPLAQSDPSLQQVQPGQQDPNALQMTPETKNRILALCDETTNVQQQAQAFLSAGDSTQASIYSASAMDKLKEIESLMPKNQNQQQQQQDQQQDSSDQSDQSDKSEDKKKSDESKSDEKKDQDEKKEEQQDKKDEEKQEDEKKDEPEPAATEARPATPEDVKQALEKALQREREHEAVLRERNRQSEMAPIGRDW